MGKFLAGTAAVAEFLFITGGADTIPTVAAVIGRSTGVGKSVFFRFFFHIRFTSPEVTVRFVHSNLLIHFDTDIISLYLRRFKKILIKIIKFSEEFEYFILLPSVRKLHMEVPVRWKSPEVRSPESLHVHRSL